ncbi:hypothetical protein [Spirosoma areae]
MDDITQLSEELRQQEQLMQEGRDRLYQLQVAEAERIRVANEAELEQVLTDAKAFRIEASRATSETERHTLRTYAKEGEDRATELRRALGIEESEPDAAPEIDAGAEHRTWLIKQIRGNLNIALTFLAAWFGLYYVGEGNTGTIGYIAQVLSKPAFHGFMLFAGLLFVFLVIRRYFYTVTEYLNRRASGESFELDFQEVSAQSRLFFVLGLLYVITQFLASIYQVTL